MVRKTNIELYEYITEILDKHQSPYFEKSTVSNFFNDSYSRFVNSLADSEEGLAGGIHLIPLKKNASVPNTNRVNLSTISPDFLRPTAVFARFNFVCKGVSSAYDRPCKFFTENSYKAISDDSFYQPNNHFPGYMLNSESGQNSVVILSSTVPLVVNLTYIKKPNKVDMENDPSGVTEVDYDAQMIIVQSTVNELLKTII